MTPGIKSKMKLLLERGYFPVQLPPCFTTSAFAKVHHSLGGTWSAPPNKLPRMQPERFSVARSSYNRRVTSILNPVGYFFLCRDLATYWPKIQNHYSRSRFSFSRPKLERGLRAIKINRFSDVHDHRLVKAAGYRYALITDISRFFPTIYTHSIPWALHTKEEAKTHKEKTPAYFGNILDHSSMGIQDFQTIGLPIGPDSSHVIAEIIGTAIDQQLRRTFGEWPSGFRYVDDFYLFFNERAEAERALAAIAQAVNGFELEINAGKTRIIETKELIEESWKYKIKGSDFASAHAAQRNDIHKFFEHLVALERSYRDESVVKYGLKIAASSIIKRQNWKIFEAYLLHCGFAYPNALQTIASLFATYARYDYPLDKVAIQRFCNAVVCSHAPSDHHSEVVWALWIMVELKLELETKSAEALAQVSSSACVLLGLSLLNKAGRTSPSLTTKLTAHAQTSALYGAGWLLAYEGGKRKWLTAPDDTFIKANTFFNELLRQRVSFFDDLQRLPAIFKPKVSTADLRGLFESDAAVDGLFEFEEEDDEYFHSSDATAEEGADEKPPDDDDSSVSGGTNGGVIDLDELNDMLDSL